MKKIIKFFMIPLIAIFARAVVRKYAPKVVMVTGSVGKTSTKDAVAQALDGSFFVRKSAKSFNSEFGVPFTILNVENPWMNPLAWLKVIKCALGLLILPNHYPNLLVLEVGADRPGDIDRALRIATPDVVVVTRLPEIPVHVEAYASPEAVREEEFLPALALPSGAPLIVSADDSYALDRAMRTSARVISYGAADTATVRVSETAFVKQEKRITGMSAELSINGENHTFTVTGSVGFTQLLPVAAALAVAHALGVPREAAIKALAGYEPPPGRGRLLEGINGAVLIDDSYNASPAAVEEALATLKKFPGAKRRIAVLGDMLELGRYSAVEHERIGKLAADAADIVAAVGVRARVFAVTAREAEVLVFDNAKSAAVGLLEVIQKGDVVLIKGSQSIRLERVVQSLLADPMDYKKLVRQEKEWKKRI